MDEEMEYGSGPKPVRLHVNVPVYQCRDCETEFTDGSAEEVRHEAVCRYLNVLTPTEIRKIRARLGLSRQRFADITRLGIATIARWESGEVIQNAALDVYLRLVSKREIFQLIESRLLFDHSYVEEQTQADERSASRFPTLVSTGEIQTKMRRAKIFKLAPRPTSN